MRRDTVFAIVVVLFVIGVIIAIITGQRIGYVPKEEYWPLIFLFFAAVALHFWPSSKK